MQTGEETDEIALVPVQITNFLVQKQQNSELVAQISTRLATESGLGTDPFFGSTLASAWYRDHPEDLDGITRSSDEVGIWHLVCFVATVLKRHRARTIHPRFRGQGVARERSSPPLGCHRQLPCRRHLKPHPRELRRPK